MAEIATEYLRTHIKITVSPELDKSALQDAAEMVFQNVFQITDEELGAYLEASTNEEGEFMLGQDELAMVAGSARLSDTNTCSYGSGCGSCQCSSSLSCVCK